MHYASQLIENNIRFHIEDDVCVHGHTKINDRGSCHKGIQTTISYILCVDVRSDTIYDVVSANYENIKY